MKGDQVQGHLPLRFDKQYQFTFQSELPVSAEDAFAWHLRPGAFERLLPPWAHFSLLFLPDELDKEGGRIGLKIKWKFLSFQWVLERTRVVPSQEFSEVQISGPFRSFHYRHHFLSIDPLSCKLSDEITFSIPLFAKNMERMMSRFFSWRHAVLKEDLKIIDRHPTQPLRILLSGSSGFIGSHLRCFLQACGHEVKRLVRSQKEEAKDIVYWDPQHGNFQKEGFEGFDAIIHLAGANIAQGRWTKSKKEELFLSRVRDTWLLSQVLNRLYRPPKILICASAIGFYGNRGKEELTEESSSGTGFLADLCDKWEKATQGIANRGTRVIHARFGVVLSAKGGMLQKILPSFRLGWGGKIGSGEQMISWIGIDDLLGGIYHVLMRTDIEGPVNLVAPRPVSQADFARILAKKIHRPAVFYLPAWLLKIALGEMANEMILSSQNVKPVKLIQTGYEFRYPDLSTALDFVMDTKKDVKLR